MQKIDLQVVSIPDHEAQLEIARLIVGGDHTISMQAAIEMAKNPPILLFRNMDVKDAKQYLNTFERLGIAFKIKLVDDTAAEVRNDTPKPAAAPHEQQAAADDSQEPNAIHHGQQVTGDSQEPDAARHGQQIQDDPRKPDSIHQARQASDGSQAPQIHQAGDDAQNDDAMREFAGIKAHNSTIDRDAEPAAPPAPPDLPDHTAHPLHEPLYAAGSAGNAPGKYPASGIRVGGTGLEKLARMEQASRKKSLMITSIAVGVLVLLGVMVLFLPKKNKFTVNTSAAVLIKKEKKPAAAKPSKSAPAPAAAPARQNNGGQRNSVSNQQKQQASAYVDSAKASGNDRENCVAFYKVAISFNRYNLPAWQGLLQAYREQGLEAEANETLEKMTSVFGDEVMSITALVKPFGDLMDAYMTGDGTYRVEYKTRKTAKDDVQREVFNLTRAVRSACSCRNISIYASTGAGRGLLAHSTQETSVHTLSAFSKHAEIVWLK